MKVKEVKIAFMLKIEQRIYDIDRVICGNLDMMESSNVSRDLISQNLLAQSRNLVEHIAVRAYGQGQEIPLNRETVPIAMAYLKKNNKYLFLRKFHSFLQESKSHYTPDNEGAERLMLKYYQYFVMIKTFVKQEYDMNLLNNLNKFPINTDKTVAEFYEKIAERLKVNRPSIDYNRNERMYVHKVIPFIVDGMPYFEMVLTPAFDSTSKFDRFIVYSKNMVPKHYAIKAAIFYDDIEVDGKKMPVNIMTEYSVSIRPCEFNNFASLFGIKIKMQAASAEYIGMMNYLTNSGSSLLDLVLLSDKDYAICMRKMFGHSHAKHFEPVLNEARKLILSDQPGSNIIRYLLHIMNNKVLKLQRQNDNNKLLSGLRLKWGCIPFDKMPFATSLIQHNPEATELFESIDAEGREHELMARYIQGNMSTNSRLYTPIKEVEKFTENVDSQMDVFNDSIYYKHEGRRLAKFGQNIYVKEALDNTHCIMDELFHKSQNGLQGYADAITVWMEERQNVDSDEKKEILQKLFEKTHVAVIYGAAGTGKTYLINHVSQFMDSHSKLFLANTNPAVENLRRKVMAQNCDFMTIRKYIMSKNVPVDVDILIMDECSMVSNADMAEVLQKVNCKILLLVGDTYQIESITFGNWFSMVKYFIPRYAWHELKTPYRTKDEDLLTLWEKVRELHEDLTEHIVANRYASNLDQSVFDKKSEDEIILCLNYDGLYGINNINRFLQQNNPNSEIRWGLWTYKVGDPILFNESERFIPLLYNNLKGTIVGIEKESEEKIWFILEIDKVLTELDIMNYDIELLDPITPGKSVIKFYVLKKKNSDNDETDFSGDTDVQFQIAYAVSIHKAQGLEYDSVKVIITEEIDSMITHNIFYTAITRSKRDLTIYWSPETQQKVISNFQIADAKGDATVFAAQTHMKMRKIKN